MAPEKNATGDPSSTVLRDMITGGWTSQAIYVAARLGIAELLAEGPRKCEELATSIGAHSGSLYRLMRGLTSLGLCTEASDGMFELTSLGSHLRAGVAGSVRSWALLWGGSLWPIWGTLLHSVRTGERLRPLSTGPEGFDNLAQRPEAAKVFDMAMVEITALVAETVVGAYDFSRIGRIVDVGGGYGELLVAILRAYPTLQGVLFELPHVVEGARKHIEAAGVAERCEAVPGNFFESVPIGAGAYLLKSIIHDWNDDRSLVVLRNCHHAITSEGKLLIIERILPERIQPCLEHRMIAASDLNMLVATTGRERTGAEYRSLLGAAGFKVTRTVPIGGYFSVIEAERAV